MDIDLGKAFLPAFEESFWYVWPIILLIIAVCIFDVTCWIRHRKMLKQAGMHEIDKMTGDQFESKLALMYRTLGYTVHQTGSHRGDYGIDLIIEKNEIRTGIQAKRHTNLVGVKAVQEIYGALKLRNCSNGMVITNSHFTHQAKHLASIDGIKLYDREDLARLLINASIFK